MPRVTIDFPFEDENGYEYTAEITCEVDEDDESVGYRGGLSDITVNSSNSPLSNATVEKYLWDINKADIEEAAIEALNDG